MGVGKVVAEVGGGIATKKVVDKVLDNEGDNKSLGKTAVSVGAGLAAAKVIDDAMDKKEDEKESKGSGVATVAGVVAAGAAVKAAMDVKEMKENQAQQNVARTNQFQAYQGTQAKQIENNPPSSFQTMIKQQEANIQQEADGAGMHVESPAFDSEYSV